MEYERQGYIPEGMVNFLALLGWSPGTDEELFSTRELIERFTLEGISGGNAVFNTDKLEWFNHQHLLRLDDRELVRRLAPRLRDAGLWDEALETTNFQWLCRVLALLRPRAKRLTDYVEGMRPFLAAPTAYDPEAVKKHVAVPGMREHLEALHARYETTTFEPAALEQALRELAEERGVKAGALIHATRIAMTGRMVSPGLFEMLALLGRDRVLARLQALTARESVR
jgi:glutamyl-tRNA synthetase